MRTMLALLLVGLAAAPLDAETSLPAENSAAAQWSRGHLFADPPTLPFSFLLDGEPSRKVLPDLEHSDATRDIDARRSERSRTWTDVKTGLQVRLVATEYADFPVAEWTLWLENTGQADTPIIESLQALDARFDRGDGSEFILHGARGDSCLPESFRPFSRALGPGTIMRFSPPVAGDKVSGKSSDGPDGWPYFNLQMPGGGVILAVGWPGQWEATFAREQAGGLQITAGQQLTRLVLRPGEKIRTPSITLLFWQGDDVLRAQNLWRSWYVAYVLPRIEGQPQPPITHIQSDGSLASWPRVEAFVDAGITPTICWRDAGGGNPWYPIAGGPFTEPKNKVWLNTGTWDIDRTKYPQGFRPFSDKVRSHGMQFLLWFEPERVGNPNSWLATRHPEWLLPGNSAGLVLNLGDPAALGWLIEHVDGLVKSEGLDWYREDCNGGNYGTAWRNHDAPDRQGITENLYVQGHLALWDELRRRNPRLRIDSCASGGRRNDLETMRRAVPLLRSDWSVTAFATAPLQVEGNQAQTYGLSAWLPWQGVGVPFLHDHYAVRSYYVTGFGMVPAGDWSKDAQKRADMQRAYAEARRVGPLLLGDYYPLTPYSLDTTSWIAWQFFRDDMKAGVIQAFRRPAAAMETLTVQLRGLEPEQRYELENFDGGKQVCTGGELMRGFDITLRARPAAALFVLKSLP